MKTAPLFTLLVLATAHAQTGNAAQRTAAVPAAPVRMCAATDLSLATDAENGNFNGMNHSGTLVVLRNLSSTACRVPAIPQLTFADNSGSLQASAQTPGFLRPGMGHGPVVLPVIVPAGAEVTSTLRWVSGEVYSKNICITPTQLTLTIAGQPQTAALAAHLCGDATKGVTYEQTRFATDPIYTPDHIVRAPQLPQPE